MVVVQEPYHNEIVGNKLRLGFDQNHYQDKDQIFDQNYDQNKLRGALI